MAEMALVNDISGVCSSRETLRITSSPVNVASMNTNSSVRKSGLAPFGRLPAATSASSQQEDRKCHDSAFVLYST